jgi:hypothetical protein
MFLRTTRRLNVRRFAFVSGLILGGGVSAWLLGSALCYLFTGKLPSIQMSEDQRLRLTLVDVDGLYETPSVVLPRTWEAADREVVG